VKVDDFKTFSDLKSYAATKYWKKYNKKDQSEISLLYFEVDSFYDILDDEAFKTFLKGYGKKKTREILVLDGTSEAKRLRKNCNVLRFCTVDKLNELEGIGETVIDKISGKKKGKFFIASCDEYKLEVLLKVKHEKDEKKREEKNNEITSRNNSKMSIHHAVQADVKLYEKIAKLWGFSEVEIKKIRNPTRKQLLDYFDAYIKEDHSEEECFVFAFSGHGDMKDDNENWIGEHILVHKDEIVKVRDLVNKLKECKLPTKGPMIMFLDACRGDKDENLYNVDEDTNNKNEVILEKDVFKHVKDEETTTTNMDNLLIAYATIPNKTASTAGVIGSVFTRILYEENKINHGWQKFMEFHQLLTEVNDRVARTKDQVSCFRSSLSERLYFRSKVNDHVQVEDTSSDEESDLN